MILEVEDLHSYYGTSHILQGLSFAIDKGEPVCLLGRNGAGKSTTFKSIIGLVKPRRGRVIFQGVDITGKNPFQIARLGMGYVPEDRRIYPDLTVLENLEVARQSRGAEDHWNLARVMETFPDLAPLQNRKGRQMSGGQQQMLTIARCLMGNPEFILLDEPSEGLAPLVVADLGNLIARIQREGITIFLAEQNSVFALRLVKRAHVIDKGLLEWQGSVEEIAANEELRLRYLSI